MLWEQSLNFFLKWWNSHWRGWEAWKVRASVFTRQQMAAVKKKKSRKRKAKGEKKKKPFQPLLFKDSYMGFAFLLIFLFPLSKAGVKFRARNLGFEVTQPLPAGGNSQEWGWKCDGIAGNSPQKWIQEQSPAGGGLSTLGICWEKGAAVIREPQNLSTQWNLHS